MAPYPETWDEVEASRYATSTDIYIPLSHFGINKARTIGFAFKGFLSSSGTTITKVEIVKTVPSGVSIPAKVPTAPLIFACTRPNSFAFAIDDGDPQLAQQVIKTVKDAGIHVTFFTVGAALQDASTNLTNVYKEMMAEGHQVAYHSYTHPYIEGLPSYSDIDWEIQNDINAVQQTLGFSTKYFRPPFGNEAARFRERLAALISNGQMINWSVDVEDWLWAESSTPEKQLDAFKRDLAKGGNLVVMHYLYPTTVGYLTQFIELAKATGKQLMRVDQCLEDPDAPPL
jgi:peptidoglycan/xylan/chitin deacetylase (PgdA/CDA1 family)